MRRFVKWFVLPPEASMALQAFYSCFLFFMASCSVIIFSLIMFRCVVIVHSLLFDCSSLPFAALRTMAKRQLVCIFDNHRAPRLAPVVLVLRYRLASDSPGEMHWHICSLNDPFRYQPSFNHSPVVLELRYRLALNSLGSLPWSQASWLPRRNGKVVVVDSSH